MQKIGNDGVTAAGNNIDAAPIHIHVCQAGKNGNAKWHLKDAVDIVLQ